MNRIVFPVLVSVAMAYGLGRLAPCVFFRNDDADENRNGHLRHGDDEFIVLDQVADSDSDAAMNSGDAGVSVEEAVVPLARHGKRKRRKNGFSNKRKRNNKFKEENQENVENYTKLEGALRKIKKDKPCGTDKIDPEMINYLGDTENE
ncbi:hypothetical protein FQA39_LY14233 [Lamprigera yunnana]|nr:hypothetical protein FQA39_LY14233 [Lamprigera yunnana]